MADWIRRAAVTQALKSGRNGTEEEIKNLLGFGNVDRYVAMRGPDQSIKSASYGLQLIFTNCM